MLAVALAVLLTITQGSGRSWDLGRGYRAVAFEQLAVGDGSDSLIQILHVLTDNSLDRLAKLLGVALHTVLRGLKFPIDLLLVGREAARHWNGAPDIAHVMVDLASDIEAGDFTGAHHAIEILWIDE